MQTGRPCGLLADAKHARRVAADELSIVRDRNESSLAGNATDPIVQVDTEAPGDGAGGDEDGSNPNNGGGGTGTALHC